MSKIQYYTVTVIAAACFAAMLASRAVRFIDDVAAARYVQRF